MGRSDLDKDSKESPASRSVHRQRAERDVPDSYNVTSTIFIPVNALASQQVVLIEETLRFFKRTLIENKERLSSHLKLGKVYWEFLPNLCVD